jgi:DNA polymerase-4
MILHVDMDAFYASVEERDRPELVGQPVVVGGTPEGRGVVAAANYAARRYGVHSAMPAAQARRLCPHAVFIRSRMAHYAEVSRQLGAVFARFTPLVEPLSLDEAFLDVSASRRLFGGGEDIARSIKTAVREELSLVASVGVAHNKFLAKLASDLEKPDGLVVVPPDAVQEFLDPLPVSRLWGVGRVANRGLAEMGVHTIAELRRLPEDLLTGRFGKWGAHLLRLAHGLDDRPVVPDRDAKSISHETTFELDIEAAPVLRSWLLDLTEQVAVRLRRQDLSAKTVFIKLRYADFRTITRSESMDVPTNLTKELWLRAGRLLDGQLACEQGPVRLLGMGVGGVSSGAPEQTELFGQTDRDRERRIDTVVDHVRDRFGTGSMRRGGGPRRGRDHRPG